MVCPECSYENLGVLKKCGWCGARLDKKKREPRVKGRTVKYRPVKTNPIKNRLTRNPPLIGPVIIGAIVLGVFLIYVVISIVSGDSSDAEDLAESDLVDDVWYCRDSDGARMFERSQMIENFGEEFYDTLTELGLEPCE